MNLRFKPTTYTPSDWYWIVAGNEEVYSSAQRKYVPTNDPAFLAWSADKTPTRIGSEEELLEVLKVAAPEGLPSNPVPSKVTPRQAFLALLTEGITEQDVIDAINTNLPEAQRAATFITLNKSLEFQRDNPLIVALGPLLGLSVEQLDNLFITAATL